MSAFLNTGNAYHLWNISGSFGRVEGDAKEESGTVTAKGSGWQVSAKTERDESGVFVRRDTFTNLSDAPMTLSSLSSRFTLDGGEWEVYTQYNGWQNENMGAWQDLVTTVSAEGISARTAVGAAPFLVLWSKQSGRGYAFHLNAYSTWQMKATKRYAGSGIRSYVELELGVQNDNLRMPLASGESIELPEILYYPVLNKTDMDAYKLHRYFNRTYPRATQPVIYNTWLYEFDAFTPESLLSQVPLAKELGAEYFVVDAGWFGIGKDWWTCVGDWEENLTGGLCGRTGELADAVREAGMEFGFWLEGERANAASKSPVLHPDYYIREGNEYFLDFGNPAAVEHITGVALTLIEKWGARIMKMDFNADFIHDKTGKAFTEYGKGFSRFMESIKKRYPDFYLESCAAGGCRNTLRDARVADAYWLSDNHSPYEDMRIYKDGVKRLPPQLLEKWSAIRSFSDFTPVYPGNSGEKILANGDACWNHVTAVHESYLLALLTGGPIGLSCDLSKISEVTLARLKEHIAAFKRDRAFWCSCECRLLCDTESVTVFEYTDEKHTDCRIVAVANKIRQGSVVVYPAVDTAAVYILNDGSERSGAELSENGLRIRLTDSYTATFTDLKKK